MNETKGIGISFLEFLPNEKSRRGTTIGVDRKQVADHALARVSSQAHAASLRKILGEYIEGKSDPSLVEVGDAKPTFDAMGVRQPMDGVDGVMLFFYYDLVIV